MLSEKLNSLPQSEDSNREIGYEYEGSKEQEPRLIAGVIASILLLLIIIATIISISIPKSGSENTGTAAGGGSGAETGHGQQMTVDNVLKGKGSESITSSESSNQSSDPLLVSVLPKDSDVENRDTGSESERDLPPSGAVEGKSLSQVEHSLPNGIAQERSSDVELSSKRLALEESDVEEATDEDFTIYLPRPRKQADSPVPGNFILSKSPMQGRSSEERLKKLASYGGTKESELAVATALAWLAKHQLPNGQWSFDHRPSCDGTCGDSSHDVNAQSDPRMLANAATGLGLLPFLGAGFTHRNGKYKDVVLKGINYLLESQQRDSGGSTLGSWMEFKGFMYSHGIASMAICEAYAMTKDPKLRPAAQAGINFTAMAQHQRGGWRYQPGDQGDMSMLGWHLMALKSGELGGLAVDGQCFADAERFIKSLRIGQSGAYGYFEPISRGDDRCTTAIGALGLYYLGHSNDSLGQQTSVKLLVQNGPDLNDLYGLYYSTQLVMHLGGDDWPIWNQKVREHLIDSQSREGHAKGSWIVAGPGPHNSSHIGGRVYCTAMSAIILETYYRHLPLYDKDK